MVMELPQRPMRPLVITQLLRAIPEQSRRGRIDGPHDPLLRGLPPLEAECGVQMIDYIADRPFHPQRLHDAFDALLEGVVCTRGRLWLANRPDEAFWIESAGEALQVAVGGAWLAAMDPDERAQESDERRVMAELGWHPEFGDRHSAVVILAHRADATALRATLDAACLTDAEMADGQALWMAYPDPFGVAHADPCDDLEGPDRDASYQELAVGDAPERPERHVTDQQDPDRKDQ